MAFEIRKSFIFDAAHHLGMNVDAGHRYGEIHGHSFEVTLAFRGDPDPKTGWVRDFAEIDALVQDIRARLDHKYLNKIDGLEQPTLERICTWIRGEVQRKMPDLAPNLSEVTVHRGSCRESCTYRPD